MLGKKNVILREQFYGFLFTRILIVWNREENLSQLCDDFKYIVKCTCNKPSFVQKGGMVTWPSTECAFHLSLFITASHLWDRQTDREGKTKIQGKSAQSADGNGVVLCPTTRFPPRQRIGNGGQRDWIRPELEHPSFVTKSYDCHTMTDLPSAAQL